MSDVFDKVQPVSPAAPAPWDAAAHLGGANGAPRLDPPGSGSVVEGGAGRRFILADEGNHVCFLCRHLLLKHQVIETAGDTDEVRRERQGTCLVEHADQTNETVTWCSHFERRGGLLVRLLDLLRFDVREPKGES